MVAVARAGQEGRRRHLRGRAHRAHAHELGAAAGDRGRGGAARQAARRRLDRARPPSRPPRAPSPPADLNASRRLQAPPGARAVQARARGGGGRRSRYEAIRRQLAALQGRHADPGRRGLPRRPGPRDGRLPGRDARAAAAAGGRGGRGQDRGRAGAGRRDRRAPDPPAVPRGHRPPPRGLRLGLRAPAARHPRGRGGRRGARALRARVPAAAAAAGGARGGRPVACC